MTQRDIQVEHERDILRRASEWPGHPTLAELTPEATQGIGERHGIDFATALLYNRIKRSPHHAEFIAELESRPPSVNTGRVTIALVPGAFYKEHPGTGADGRLIGNAMRLLGCGVETIPLASLGSLEENARIIHDWLTARASQDEILILISLSKGGADVKWALAKPDADVVFSHVAGWINISGILQGSTLTGWLFDGSWHSRWTQFLLRVQRYDLEVAQEMSRRKGSLLDCSLQFPEWMRVIHIVGFPLEHHLSGGLARKGYERSRHLGPNDSGGIVLADACQWRGELYPVWGADHYLRPRFCDLNNIVTQALSLCLAPSNQPVTT